MPDPREERLVAEYLGLAYAIAREFYFAGADEDDVKQEALVGLLRGIRDYDPARGGRTAFFKLAIRRQLITALLAARRQKHVPLTAAVRAVEMDGEPVPAIDLVSDRTWEPVDFLDRRAALRDALSGVRSLSEIERASLDVVLSGERYEDAAERLGISTKAIDNGVQRSRRKIRARLAA